MPKVLRIINRFNLGGPTYNAAYLTKYLEPEFETLLIGGQKEDSEESSEHILDEIGVKGHIIPELERSINFKNDRIAYKKIKKIIQDFKPDIVHTHASKAGALGRLAAITCNVPVVLHTFHGHVFHSYFNRQKTMVFKTVEKYLARKTNGIIAISDIQKEELSKEHKIDKPERTTVIPLGFDLDRFYNIPVEKSVEFREKYNIPVGNITVGIIGRLVPVKNHKLFIDAIALLKQKHNNITAVVVGDGELKDDLLEYSHKSGLTTTSVNDKPADIIFTSWIKDVSFALAGIDIVAMTSLNEGTPVSLIEAQAAGKPIVTTDVGGIKNVIDENKTGLLSDFCAEEFSDKINYLIQNPDFIKKAKEAGPKHVAEKFSYKRLAKDVKSLYLQLLEG